MTHSTAAAVTPALLREWPLPEPGDSKDTRGHVLVVGGARGTPGAVLLSGLAALRVGAGVLAMAVPDAVAVALAVAVPESGVGGWELDGSGRLYAHSRDQLAARVEGASAVLVGPGIDDGDVAAHLVRTCVEAAGDSTPFALDAFALGALADAGEDVAPSLAGRLVLTPNQSEARLLLDAGEDALAELADSEIAQRIADRWQGAVAYQGAVAAPDGPARASASGDSGLGTSGSGDVLAGAAAGLLARGAGPEQAAAFASYLHAAAGDRLAARVGRLGYLARELLDELPQVLSELSA